MTDCKEQPKGKMCSLAKKGKLKKIKKLSSQPGFICSKCGRPADCEKNLCKPVAFDKL